MPRSTQCVEPGLEGQLDPEPHADAAGLAGALVGRLHRARAAAGDHGEAGLDQRAADLLALGVRRVVRPGPRGAEHRDRRARARPGRRSPRRTRPGSAAPATDRCAPSRVGPRESSSRWSVVAPSTWSRRMHRPGPWTCVCCTAGLVIDRRPASRAAAARSARSARPARAPPACGPASGRPARSSPPGTPSAVNRATSVQPNFGLTGRRRPLDELLGGRHGRGPGRAPGALSVTVTS